MDRAAKYLVYNRILESCRANSFHPKREQVVEVVERELSEKQQFAVADVNRHVEFDCNRHMRLLCRRGFLESVPEGGKICGFR